MKRSELKKGDKLIAEANGYITFGVEFEEWIDIDVFLDQYGNEWMFYGEEDDNYTFYEAFNFDEIIDCRAETNYVHFKVAPYALNDVAKALTISEIEFSVTKEDNDLIIRYKL